MLIQMLIHQPQALGPILKSTPAWVWALLAALTVLGLSQARARSAGLTRVTLVPAVMTSLSLFGAVTSFGASPLFSSVLLTWLAATALAAATMAATAPPAGTHYDARSRTFNQPGSWVPMMLIAGIFLTKYVGGVELAMQPALAYDSEYTLVTAALYGLFSGIFVGRAARLWRLAFRPQFAAGNEPLNA